MKENLVEKEKEALTPEKRRLHLLTKCWGQVNAFGTDDNDEFIVLRENGRKQGIFKTWAIPVIPFLERDKLEVISSALPVIRAEASKGLTFEQSLNKLGWLGQNIKSELSSWKEEMNKKPLKFAQQLEKAVNQGQQIDRRLMKIFSADPLADNPKKRIGQLVNRLCLTLGLLSPFYNLEALVGGQGENGLNPVKEAQKTEKEFLTSGDFDLIAMTLPSALTTAVVAREGDWQGLTWQRIEEITKNMLQNDSQEKRIILKLAKRLGVTPKQIIFATNVLEFIPKRVGGKVNDFDQNKAMEITLETLDKQTAPSENREKLLTIAGKFNALIRFFNWIPARIAPENFRGEQWSYGSLCDTSAQLRETLLTNPEVWQEGFGEVFNQKLSSQIANLDAESAKARFLLHLILIEKKLKPEFLPSIDADFIQATIEKLMDAREKSWLHSLGSEIKPIGILGGKAFGLEFLKHAVRNNEFNVPPGLVVTTEAVDDFLRKDRSLWNLILTLDGEENTDKRLEMAEAIRQSIKNLEFNSHFLDNFWNKMIGLDGDLFAVRSSSTDEDNPEMCGMNNPGIHETLLKIKRPDLVSAIKTCIASFFNEPAINLRQQQGTSDIPLFAVLIQPMIKGIGGIAFSRDLQPGLGKCTIEVAEEPWQVANGIDNKITRFILNNLGIEAIEGDPSTIDGQSLTKVKTILEKLEQLTGEEIDLEWVLDLEGKVWILQSRTLPKVFNEAQSEDIDIKTSAISINEKTNFKFLSREIEQIKGPVALDVQGVNLETFQGEFFVLVTRFGNKIRKITLEKPISRTCHFANICGCLGIKIL